jgi:hypothetical protein
MATGGGHSILSETAELPTISKRAFINIETQIRRAWELLLAGSTCNRRWGWSKRSHKHSYNAKSAVIIAQENSYTAWSP